MIVLIFSIIVFSFFYGLWFGFTLYRKKQISED